MADGPIGRQTPGSAVVTGAPVEDVKLFGASDAAQMKLLLESQTGTSASRYVSK